MKTTISLLILFAFAPFFANGQTINEIPLSEVDVEYIQIVGTSKMMTNKVTVEIDFGQENSYWSNKDAQLKDENGDLIEFNSMIDALNFMASFGYEFQSAYGVSMGNQNVYHYLLRKKKPGSN